MANEAEILAVADAVTTALNGNAFAAPYASLGAVRKYVPVYNLKDLTSLQVTVVPHGLLGKVIDRAFSREMGNEIDIGFQVRVPGLTPATLDGLMALVESVGDFLMGLGQIALAGGKVATPVGIANDPIYDPKMLDEQQVFLSVLTVAYRTFR